MRMKLTPGFVAKAAKPASGDRTIYWDTELRGFGLMVTAGGHRSFVVQYRTGRVSRRMHLKGGLNLSEARKKAKAELGCVAKGGDPLFERRKKDAAGANTLRSICEVYLTREERQGKLRSIAQRRAMLERLVYPKLGAQPIDEILRSDIVRLLDRIDDERGASMADHVLAVVRRVMSWHASRTDHFRSPIVRGMARTSAKAQARERILDDEELRAVWKAANELKTPFARMVQFILVTGVRRNEAARMDRSELSGSEWLIPAARFKGKRDFLVPLTQAALTVLAELPVIGQPDKGPLFTHDGKRPLGGFGKFKANFDKKCGVTGWTIHDLRRTARTLMSRAGVDKDHAERALGHVIGGIRGVYDRHEFEPEKRRAFEALVSLIERIVSPQQNVVPLRTENPIGTCTTLTHATEESHGTA
jgi:integrase